MPIPPQAAPGALFLEPAAVPLLLLHAVAGFAAVGATTHHAAYALLAARGRRRPAALRRFGWLAPAALALALLVGFVVYPTYRVRVRAAHFDVHAPVWSQLFDLKEHLAVLALALVLAAALAGRALARADDPARDAAVARAVAALSSAGALFVWLTALLGLAVTARHPLGMP